jgi:anti-sigma B factor antagonist
MRISVRQQGPVAVIDLAGRLVFGDGDQEIVASIQSLLDAGTTAIVLNMEGVPFMDSSGLKGLITCHKRAARPGGAVHILKPTPRVAELLAVTRLTDIFGVFDEETAAIASFKGRGDAPAF